MRYSVTPLAPGLKLPSTWGATAPRGRGVVGEQQAGVSPRSSTATGNGTVPRPGRTSRAAGAALPTSLRAGWRRRGRWRRATTPAGPCATRRRSDATTSCTAPTAATRRTAASASREPFTVTVAGQCARLEIKICFHLHVSLLQLARG